MKETRTVFGRRLRRARLEQKFTQKGLGIAAGLDPGTASARLAQYERGTHTPPFETAEKLARTLSVPAAYFYARDEDLAGIILAAGRAGKQLRRRLLASLYGG